MRKKLRSDFNSRQYMLSEDFELFYYSDRHFQSIGTHSHSYYEVYLFVEGKVDMEIGGKMSSLRPGDVILVPPGTPHRASVGSGETPYRRFVFWISLPFCEQLRRESADYLYLFDRVQTKKSYVYPLSALDFNALRGKFAALLEELNTDRFGRDTQIGLLVRALMLYLCRCIRARAKKEQLSSYQAIAEDIAGHLDEDLSLDALSRKFFLNKYHIAHLFQENAGLSLHQYITKKRLDACCDAMCSGANLAGCCAQFGFENYSSFYRAFRKEYGVSPSDYRNSLLPSVTEEDR